MKTKPLEEKLKKMNEGVLSVELVEAPESKLPAKVENDEKKPVDDWDYLDYRVDQANKHERYIPLLKKDIDDVLNNHDFVEEKGYYSRIRGDYADYLFLENFVDKEKEGTFWATLDYDESKGFEKMLDNYIIRQGIAANYWEGGSSRPVGPLLLGFAGGISIGLGIGVSLSDYFGGVGAIAGLISGFASWLGIFGGIAELDRSRLKKKAEKVYDEIMEKYGKEIKSEDKKYDLDVIKHFLELTPKQLLDKQIKQSIDPNVEYKGGSTGVRSK